MLPVAEEISPSSVDSCTEPFSVQAHARSRSRSNSRPALSSLRSPSRSVSNTLEPARAGGSPLAPLRIFLPVPLALGCTADSKDSREARGALVLFELTAEIEAASSSSIPLASVSLLLSAEASR